MESLHLVAKEELPQLLQWLEHHLPHSWMLAGIVREEILGRWDSSFPILTLGWPDVRAVGTGAPKESCSVVDYYSNPRKISVFSPKEEDARDILTHPGYDLDWSKPMFFTVPDELGDLVVSLSEDHCSSSKGEGDGDDLPQRYAGGC